MSQQQRSHSPQRDNKRQRTTPLNQSSTVHIPTAPLLHLPTAILSSVYLYLPWYERLLHLTHLYRHLPPASLVWTEYDHVRLSEALLDALEQLRPSAVQCCRYVQSLWSEREMDAELKIVVGEDTPRRLQLLVQKQRHSQPPHSHSHSHSHSQSATPPFSSLRSLIASLGVFDCLLDCSGLPHLHSLSLHKSDMGNPSADESYALLDYLQWRPALRRLRLERLSVDYVTLLALPHIEHIDLRGANMRRRDAPVGAPASSSLRSLLLEHTGNRLSTRRMPTYDFFTSSANTSLQLLSLSTRLTNDDLRTITTLQSLTALEFRSCTVDDTNALSQLISAEHAEPLLPNLQHFVADHCLADQLDYEDRRESTAAFLRAYSRQLTHLKLIVPTGLANTLADVLSVIVSSMPQLESLELDIVVGSPEAEVVLDAIVLPSSLQQPHAPALPALRALEVSNLRMSDAAVDQLLACCPQLLELTICCVRPLTAAVWSSLLHCRQLLSFCFYPASVVATEAAFTAAISSSSSSSSPSSRPPVDASFPSLTFLGFDFKRASHTDPQGFARLLSLFDGSPITSVALQLPPHLNYYQIVGQLASLPRLTSLLLDVHEWDETVSDEEEPEVEAKEEDEQSDDEQQSMCGSRVVQLLGEHSEPRRWSSEQHSVNMTCYWRDGLFGEEADELRANYAAGVKAPFAPSDIGRFTGYRVFKKAQSSGEDGRAAFFRSLTSAGQREVSVEV